MIKRKIDINTVWIAKVHLFQMKTGIILLEQNIVMNSQLMGHPGSFAFDSRIQ